MLLPVTVIAYYLVRGSFDRPTDNLQMFVMYIGLMNFGLLVFNMLPIYPLDGGQTLMALLWYVIGRAKALKFVSTIGLIAAAIVLLLAVVFQELWYIVLALFVGMQAWNGYRVAMYLARLDPKHYDERYAKRAAEDEVEDRIQSQIDPWRRG